MVDCPTTMTWKDDNVSILHDFVLWFSYKQFWFRWLEKNLVSKSRSFFHTLIEDKSQVTAMSFFKDFYTSDHSGIIRVIWKTNNSQ